jgi:acetyl-CoA carboxylase biotin carboxyl carrier protein
VEFDFNELRELLTVLNQTDISELTLKSDSFELTVRKEMRVGDRSFASTPIPIGGAESPAVIAPISIPVTPAAMVPAANGTPSPPTSAPLVNERLVSISSPMVGTFYRSPAPDEPPFVEVGDRVRSNQTVCIIEAMKLMNEIEAEIAGEIVEILVQNGESVEYGQVLMRVNPGI